MKEIEEARERLQDDLEELAGRLPRLPEGGVAAGGKALLPAAGAVAGGLVVWLVDRRTRRRRAAQEAAERAVSEEWMETLREGGWQVPATVAVGVWGLVRLAEARSMRRLSKALVKASERGSPPRR